MFCETTSGDRGGVEELLRTAAPPVSPPPQGGDTGGGLSQGLRERIIAEAVTARAASVRQSRRGRVGIVLGLSLAFAMFVGRQPSLSVVHPEAIVISMVLEKVEISLTRDSAATVSVLTSGPGSLDWNQVELMSHRRRWKAHTLRSAFGS